MTTQTTGTTTTATTPNVADMMVPMHMATEMAGSMMQLAMQMTQESIKTLHTASQWGMTAAQQAGETAQKMTTLPWAAGMAMPEGWRKSIDDQMARVKGVMDEMAKVEAQSMQTLRESMDEMAKLNRATLDYAQELTTAGRKLSMDMVQRNTGATSTKA